MENAKSSQEIIEFLKQAIARETKDPIASIDVDTNFFEFGFDSINSLYLIQELEDYFDVELNPLYFWEYPSIRLLAEQIHKEFSTL